MIALLIAGGVSMGVSLVGTRALVPWLRARGVGQPIRLDGPEGHLTKAGTPTMGGVVIVVGAVAGYLVSHLRGETIVTRSGIVLVCAITAASAVGLIDDWIKVSRERNLGLNKSAKIIGLLGVAGRAGLQDRGFHFNGAGMVDTQSFQARFAAQHRCRPAVGDGRAHGQGQGIGDGRGGQHLVHRKGHAVLRLGIML